MSTKFAVAVVRTSPVHWPSKYNRMNFSAIKLALNVDNCWLMMLVL